MSNSEFTANMNKMKSILTPLERERISRELTKETNDLLKRQKRALTACERNAVHLDVTWKNCLEKYAHGARHFDFECKGIIEMLNNWLNQAKQRSQKLKTWAPTTTSLGIANGKVEFTRSCIFQGFAQITTIGNLFLWQISKRK